MSLRSLFKSWNAKNTTTFYKPNIIMLIDRRFILLIAIAITSVTKAHAQVEDISSRFYFPGSLGLGFPLTNSHTHLNDGLTINTAIEYRPTYSNDIFFRIDYDALNNNYTSYKQ